MDNFEAEQLLLEYSAGLQEIDDEKAAIVNKHREKYKELAKLRSKLQEVCIHPAIRTDFWTDYHRREDFEDHYCTLCGKLVKRI